MAKLQVRFYIMVLGLLQKIYNLWNL